MMALLKTWLPTKLVRALLKGSDNMARQEQRRTLKVCDICGKEFMGIGVAKVCGPACRKEATRIKEAIKRAKLKEQYTGRKKEMSELARINEEARAAGMSYGQYVSWCESEKKRAKRLALCRKK